MNSYSSLATAHLILRLQPINRALRAAVEAQKIAAARLVRPDVSALCLTDEHVQLLLDQIEVNQSGTALAGVPAELTAEERQAEADLCAQASGFPGGLPLERLLLEIQLTPFELEALLFCAAPEVDRSYERVFGFILDDLNRRFPCLELLSTITSSSWEEIIERRPALGPCGRLRRCGLLQSIGDPPTQMRQEFNLGPGVFDFLTGAETDLPRLWRDLNEVTLAPETPPPPQVSECEFAHLCDAIAQGAVSSVGLWGPRQNGAQELAKAICAGLRRPLRRLSTRDLDRPGIDPVAALLNQFRMASSLRALLWLETDALLDPGRERTHQLLADLVADAPVPVLLTGEHPWRPLSLLHSGKFMEFELGEADHPARAKAWSRVFPDFANEEIDDLASRFSLCSADIRSVSDLAHMHARIAGNGTPEPVHQHLQAACAVVTRRSSGHFSTIVQSRRGPDDLILPERLHRQVLEVATFFRLRNRVDSEWGFGRLLAGRGLKALFTGEPGTGKTLAAEVIAGLLGLPLSRVDLARVVSKWVGETEKNLECAFREAEESHAVLFFDEAEALFGRRAEVQHGTDRYANLEVSYLLQRLENSQGLVILASNVKDQIDPAFTRRFQVALHFPKPGFEERLRIWKLAFPSSAPRDPDLDFEALAQLDMTGAAIVTAARTAAMLAADSKAPTIAMAHVIHAAARQYRREARVLTPVELGPYGALLQEAS